MYDIDRSNTVTITVETNKSTVYTRAYNRWACHRQNVGSVYERVFIYNVPFVILISAYRKPSLEECAYSNIAIHPIYTINVD